MWATNDITYKLLRIIDIAISSSQSVGNLIKEAYRVKKIEQSCSIQVAKQQIRFFKAKCCKNEIIKSQNWLQFSNWRQLR